MVGLKIVAIIQARTSSSRLPNKVMRTLVDRTVLGHVIMRCKAIPSVNEVVVATSDLQEDDIISLEAEKYEVSCYRGSLTDVLDRYYQAAKASKADVVVRITSDCPLLDPEISEKVIKDFLIGDYDYVSSGLSGTFPRGLDTEVFTVAALQRAYKEAALEYEHEHVTPYLYQRPELFKIKAYHNEIDQSQYRLTLDTIEDWELIHRIYQHLYQNQIFNLNAILQLFEKHSELPLLNADVVQKKLGE
ncbi:glycosyltransferase family protein [Saccharibacillus qingshengii]|uniref:glycosyltransferase family protein n=1 Tax=Saccharibacillus qingshengii TaxID=1763540 RepID=UPI001FEAD3B7|nr:glycosyltransferase family protein [Saccharibacillus qingshengii]